MVERVLEINGSNAYLKCTVCNRRSEEPTSDFDGPLSDGLKANCPRCISNPSTTRPGYLLPDILLDDEATEIWGGNQRADKLVTKDGNCDVLLVLGPQLKSTSAARVLQALADKVHLFGGIVIYVDWKTLAPKVWGRYIDIHLEGDADMWAEDYLNNLSKISKIVNNLNQMPTCSRDVSPSGEDHAQEAGENVRPKKKLRFAPGTKGDTRSIQSH
ncbi:hypothetical protein FRC08_016036 [Ceratobasidium sp. 394]|nr:hypothetical protein FRC08_016036 [Ceratobasidium sp. 394]